jgi:hypothetical protein
MGGYGSGQQGGRATVESAWRFDIDALVRGGAIKAGKYVEGRLNLPSCDDELAIEFESSATNPRNSWLRLRYAIRDYWTGEQHQIDDKIYLTASRPWFGGQRWWFVCPNENRRVRKLYLPPGARRFRSRTRLSACLCIAARSRPRQGHAASTQALPEARRCSDG